MIDFLIYAICLLCPIPAIALFISITLQYYWRNMARFWEAEAHAEAVNRRRQHPLRECICRAGMKNGLKRSIGGIGCRGGTP